MKERVGAKVSRNYGCLLMRKVQFTREVRSKTSTVRIHTSLGLDVAFARLAQATRLDIVLSCDSIYGLSRVFVGHHSSLVRIFEWHLFRYIMNSGR